MALTPAEALTALHVARRAAREAFWKYADANLGAKGTEEERAALEKARDAASVKVDRAMSALLAALDAAPGDAEEET